jgi:hypothetical protein
VTGEDTVHGPTDDLDSAAGRHEDRSIGLHPSGLDYSRMPDGFDEAGLAARIHEANAALREAGFDAVPCLIDISWDRAEATVREHLQGHEFGLAVIGAGLRTLPERALLFERLVNLLTEAAPGIRLCFNTTPEDTIEALRRWIQAQTRRCRLRAVRIPSHPLGKGRWVGYVHGRPAGLG